MTFWERLQQAIDNKRITVADLSRAIGIAQSSIHSWKTKGAIPRADVAVKTAEILGTNVEWLINGSEDNSNQNIFQVPVLNQELSAGKGELLPDEDLIQGFVTLPVEIRRTFGNNLASHHVHGDSMEPTLYDGDMVVCDSLGWDCGEGIYAVQINGNGYVKRIQAGNSKLFIMSDNPKYKTIEEPLDSECIKIIGKVRLILHRV